MNRSLINVLFGGFGSGDTASGSEVEGEMKALLEDSYYVLEAAQNVVFVPGYGMAVAQAQHVVKESLKYLKKMEQKLDTLFILLQVECLDI